MGPGRFDLWGGLGREPGPSDPHVFAVDLPTHGRPNTLVVSAAAMLRIARVSAPVAAWSFVFSHGSFLSGHFEQSSGDTSSRYSSCLSLPHTFAI